MRDLIVIVLVLAGSVLALRRPWVGIMVWTWLSIMNPHRYSWGLAYDAPLAAIAAASTLMGLFMTPHPVNQPLKGAPTVWLLLFSVWMTVSWLMGLDPVTDYDQWNKVIKIYLMTFVALAVLRDKVHIHAFVWVSVGSIGLLAVKGGIFTIASGGSYRVWGPPGTFIEDNNEMALATIVCIPLLRYIQLQYTQGWRVHALTIAMILASASALGSHSRGAIIAIAAMAMMLWWRGGSRIVGGLVMLMVAINLVAFMPDNWSERISTISNYEEDRSAQGRLSAWWTAWGVAKNYVFGAGFNVARPFLVQMYSPYPDFVHAAHSIYFQVLGNHGFIGLFLWLGIFVSTYLIAGSLRKEGGQRPETVWCAQLGSMVQVSLVGYMVGGAFLSLSYFDLPYNIMVIVVLTRAWLLREAWKTENVQIEKRWLVDGLALLGRGAKT